MRAGTNGAPTYDYDNIQRLEYSYDAVGNITQLIDRHAPAAGSSGLQTATYTYDDLNRLRTAAYAGVGYMGQSTYAYDLTGNLDAIYLGAALNSDYEYGQQATNCPHGALTKKQHAATSVTLSSETRSYCYDPNGNLTRRIKGGNTDTFTYDHENRLTQVTRGGSALAQYAYDGDGRRVKSVAGGVTTYYVNDLVEYSSGVLTTFYVSGDGQRVAQRVGGAAPTYLLVDHLGSTRYVLNNSAQTLSAQRYFPWGSSHFATDANALPRRQYTGQMNDGDTDLYYYNARYYEPGLARFIQADTIVLEPGNPQALNRYAYALNSPIVYNDPTGHCTNLIKMYGCIQNMQRAWSAYSKGKPDWAVVAHATGVSGSMQSVAEEGLALVADMQVITDPNTTPQERLGPSARVGLFATSVGDTAAGVYTLGKAALTRVLAMPLPFPMLGASAGPDLINELAKQGIKHSADDIVRIARMQDERIVFLEVGRRGEGGSGLAHILEEHARHFANRGISEAEIPDLLFEALRQNQVVGTQGVNRPVYEVIFNGQTQYVSITVGSNGYIVGANPATVPLP